MMKVLGIVALFMVLGAHGDLQCEHRAPNVPKEWIDMQTSCVSAVRSHVMEELRAAMQYMAMGAHFSRDQINRPGFANLFFKAASEEREHAIKLIEYLLMRGELTSEVSNMITRNMSPNVTNWASGASALKDALMLEASVTKKIRNLIKVCEDDPANFNDYHLVDYLTGDFLTEQYEGQRDLAGKLSSLEKLMNKHGALGEFLFDKKLM
ncbi:ferritin subunit [Anthonomus grandis grandis]|uniref:ferritin subunit n=1 Tax=Anthonomus grandis grandis TaxID=2921223 RepID=UPI00216543C4|nr:ferritin subunit [Anthonomus grandis grandis]